mgnify:CR=1 FL=1|jgi:ribonucleoside-triphosphate reductase
MTQGTGRETFTEYEYMQYLAHYARWDPEHQRREYWPESIDRYLAFFKTLLAERCGYKIPDSLYRRVRRAILTKEVMPSMRCLWTAGEALARDEAAAYNCGFLTVSIPRAFDETMYLLMCGCGVGFSVEKKYTDKLPYVNDSFNDTDTTVAVHDSRKGWAKSVREFIGLLYNGVIPKWDVSRVRPAGSVLKTFGGRASGPEPLVSLFEFCIKVFKGAAGRKLTPAECHHIMTKIGECVVSGGVRRSAMISLSDLGDYDMRHLKDGAIGEENGHLELANNSAVYDSSPSPGQFMKEWEALYASKRGERGIFNLGGIHARDILPTYDGRRDHSRIDGTNPCAEILLRDQEFCNLSEIVVTARDTFTSLARKAEIAAILGTWQSTLTDFKYVRPLWQKNCEEERLLGVSMTGICDNPNMISLTNGTAGKLAALRQRVVAVNAKMAAKLGINPSVAATCVKPSGTVSQVVGSASGIHPRYAPYYFRRVEMSQNSPMARVLREAGVPMERSYRAPEYSSVFVFPIKSPDNALCIDNLDPVQHLKIWKMYQDSWCEHKPSVTIYVKEHQWLDVGAWVYKNFNDCSGVSFFPVDDHIFEQAPYESVGVAEYEQKKSEMPEKIDWYKLLSEAEKEDQGEGAREYACVSGACEL